MLCLMVYSESNQSLWCFLAGLVHDPVFIFLAAIVSLNNTINLIKHIPVNNVHISICNSMVGVVFGINSASNAGRKIVILRGAAKQFSYLHCKHC